MPNNNINDREVILLGEDNSKIEFNYEEVCLGDKLEVVRDKLSKLDFIEGLNILAIQPGVGKTHKIKQYLKSNKNWVVTAPDYNLIENEYEEITRFQGVNYWKGFDKKCPKYLNGNSKVTALRNNFKLNPSIICGKSCNDKEQIKCPYRNQFKNSNKVITSSTFYNTPYFYDKDNFRFGIAIVDEELSGYKNLEFNLKEIEEALGKIFQYVDYPLDCKDLFDFRAEFREILENKNLFSSKSEDEYASLIFFGIEDDQKEALKLAIKDEKWDDVKVISKLNILELKKWLYYYSIYGEERVYGDPNIYKLFDLARQEVKVIFSDASFSNRIFKEIYNRYKYENSIISRKDLLKTYSKSKEEFIIPKMSDEIPTKVYKSGIKNKNFIIYNMWSGQNFFRKHTNSPKIPQFIKKTLRKYPYVAIISFKEGKDNKQSKFSNLGDFAYFWRLRGINKLKNNQVLFVIGTPIQGGLQKDFNALFVKNIEESVKPDLKNKNSDLDSFQFFQKYNIESELYQAIHRIRPFEYPDKEIFVFGHVPEGIYKEFKVINLPEEEFIEYSEKQFTGVYPYSLANAIMQYNLRNPCSKSLDIAKALKLYKIGKKKGYNTKLVTAIRKGEIELKKIDSIDKTIKNGAKTIQDIKDECGSLKIDDENLEYFLYYSKFGDFIKLPD